MQFLPSVYTSQGIGQPPGWAPGGQSLTFSAMDEQALREFVALYASELADLTFNSKPIINTLTMLASENVNAASSVAAAIENHLLTVRFLGMAVSMAVTQLAEYSLDIPRRICMYCQEQGKPDKL